MENILSELNEAQRKAVQHINGPSLIIAGAGSGKTRVLTTRIAYLVHNNIDPFKILALTFTNKAASEMRERIQAMIGTEAKNLWMGTFHSVFARILRREAEKIKYPVNFTIYDTEDSKKLIKTIVKEKQLDAKLYKASFVYNVISNAKNNFIKPIKYFEDEEINAENISTGKPKLGEIYVEYAKRCFKAGAMDFDDLLVKTHDLLDTFPDVLNKYQQFFKYVLVDEFQDTNLVQYLIIKKISASNRNISVVGDDAQSIYSFRGANIKNILNFEKDYPELKIFKLEQNYRSTKMIVSASDNVIKKNKYQLEKKLWTSNLEGNKIKLLKANSENNEGEKVVHIIFNELKNKNFQPKDFAILYRTNAQSRAFEESLRRLRIPYRIIGGISFYQRKEIKDVLAYCRLALNTKDEEAIRRIINYPKRGIGATTLVKLSVWANENNVSLWDVACNIDDSPLSARVKNAIRDFTMLIKSFIIEIEQKNAFEAVSKIVKETGIQKLLYEDEDIENKSRYENLQTLLTAIKEFSIREDIEDNGLGTFLQEVSLLTDADTKADSDNYVPLMTIHSAKGLEFPVVFVVGMEETLFPSQMALDTREDIEEERRLFYVALTRAEQKLFLSFAESRFQWGNMSFNEPSRFIEEIESKYLDYETIVTTPQRAIPQKQVVPKPVRRTKFIKKVEPNLPSNFRAQDMLNVQVGMQIEHSRFGKGKILNIEGNLNNKKATIFFPDFGQKTILLKFAKMKIID